MPYSDFSIAITYVAGLALFVAAYLFLSIRHTKNKAKARIRGRFGQPPPQDDRDIHGMTAYYVATSAGYSAPEIDGITWNDLDMDKVFRRINACESSVGEEYLYAQIHRQVEPHALEQRERLIEWLDANPDACFEIQYTLSCLGKEAHNGLHALVKGAQAKVFKNASLLRILAVMPVVSAPLLFINTLLGVAAIISFAFVNFFVYHHHKLKMDADFVTLRYLSGMFACCKLLLGKKFTGWDDHAQGLRAAYKPFRFLTGRMAGTYLSRQAVSELQVIIDMAKQSFLMDVVRYSKVMRTIAVHQDEFRRLYAALGEIDTAISVLSYRKSLPRYCLPGFHERNAVEFEEIYHPLLSNPVTNSGSIRRGSVITGSNASGKSTFIKALAVNGILAQTIHTCCAGRFVTRPALVMTSMAVRDSITDKESYFITELKSLKRILDTIPKRYCVCYIDEILRGTNTIERIAASGAVLRHLAAQDCLCVVASHDIELTDILAQTHDNYSFSERVTEKGIEFDYKLQEGAAKTRNAILLLGYMGFDPSIVQEAMDHSML